MYPFWKLYRDQRDLEDAAKEAKNAADRIASACADVELQPEPTKKSWRPGRRTFLLILEHMTMEVKNKTCLSYCYTRMVISFENHDAWLVHLLNVYDAGVAEWKAAYGDTDKDRCPILPRLQPRASIVAKRREAKAVFGFAKHHLHKHLTVGGHDPDGYHCVNYALGGCQEKHTQDCVDCGKLHRFGQNLSKFHQEWYNDLARACETTLPSFKKSSRTAAATEDTVPTYVGRVVQKSFDDHG